MESVATEPYKIDIFIDNKNVISSYIVKTKAILGRKNVDINIEHQDVSEQHLTFKEKNGVLSVVDMGGPKGTTLDGIKLSPGKMVILDSGDSLKIGKVTISISKGGEIEKAQKLPAPKPDLFADEKIKINMSMESDQTAVLGDKSTESSGLTSVNSFDELTGTNEVSLDFDVSTDDDETLQDDPPGESVREFTVLDSDLIEEELDLSKKSDKKETVKSVTQILNITKNTIKPSQEKISPQPVKLEVETSPNSFQKKQPKKDKTVLQSITKLLKIKKKEESTREHERKTQEYKNQIELTNELAVENKTVVKASGIEVAKIKKKKFVEVIVATGFLLRTMAYLNDALISLIIFYSVNDQQWAKNFIKSFQLTIKNTWDEFFQSMYLSMVLPQLQSFFSFDPLEKFLVLIGPVSEFIVIVIVLRLFSVLLFGVTIGQSIIGIRGGKSFIWNRIGGFLRETLGYLTFLFHPIFDFPSIFHKRTFKELLTGTELKTHKLGISIILSIFIFPILLFLVCLSPLVVDFKNRDGFNLKYINVSKLPIVEIIAGEKQLVQSEYFKFTFPWVTNDYQFFISFQSLSIDNQRVIKPTIHFYDDLNNQTMSMQVLGKFSFEDAILKNGQHDPFFSIFNEGLIAELNNKNQINRIEQIRFIESSLGLSLENIQDQILSTGPFIGKHVFFRKQFLEIFKNKKLHFEILNIDNKSFLSAQHSELDNAFTEYLIGIDEKESLIYELKWQTTKNLEVSRRETIKKFFANIKWKDPIKKLDDKQILSNILLKFHQADLKNEEREIIERQFFEYYFNLGSSILKNDKNELAKYLAQEIDKIKTLRAEILPFPEKSANFLDKMGQLQTALLNFDKEFFAVADSVMSK